MHGMGRQPHVAEFPRIFSAQLACCSSSPPAYLGAGFLCSGLPTWPRRHLPIDLREGTGHADRYLPAGSAPRESIASRNFRRRSMPALGTFAHPLQGLRFRSERCLVLHAATLRLSPRSRNQAPLATRDGKWPGGRRRERHSASTESSNRFNSGRSCRNSRRCTAESF